jgi:glycosyltransferase involved in cell wall biosynthesis
MPAYNCETLIGQSIQSVCSQKFTDWELIIVDDNSNDNTNNIINQFSKRDDRIIALRLENNSGAALARNTALQQAKGKYIAFLDCDDLWTDDKLEKQIAFMEKNAYALTYTNYYTITHDGNVIGNNKRKFSQKVNYNTMLWRNYIPNSSAIYDSSKLGKIYVPEIRKKMIMRDGFEYRQWKHMRMQ